MLVVAENREEFRVLMGLLSPRCSSIATSQGEKDAITQPKF